MKWLISIAVILTLANLVYAAEPTASAGSTSATTSAKAPNSAQTNMSFDELLIQGQYHFSDEAVVTVEDDKVLDALLGVRKDFKDRIQQSATR